MRNQITAIVFLAIMTAACGNGGGEAPGCVNAAHEGLLCFIDAGAEHVGRCTAGSCVAIPCEVPDDCNDRTGNDACRTLACTSGACVVTPQGEGFQCSRPDGFIGTCASGNCQ